MIGRVPVQRTDAARLEAPVYGDHADWRLRSAAIRAI